MLDFMEVDQVNWFNTLGLHDPIIHILSYLNYRDLTSCSLACRALDNLAQYDALWKKQCWIYWIENECPPDKTWKQLFIDMYHDFGRYIHIYKSVKKAWNQIETYTSKFFPKIYETLQDGLSESEIDRLEAETGFQLFNDMRCIYRIHDGQSNGDFDPGREGDDAAPPVAGLLGCVKNYDYFRNEQFLPLETSLSRGDARLQSLPISVCYWSLTKQYCALSGATDVAHVREGQVFYLVNYKKHNVTHSGFFISGDNFVDWFTRYAQELEDDIFPKVNGYIFRFYHEPSAFAETNHVRIKVATAFIPEQSKPVDPPVYVHAYRITMWMEADVPERHSCVLETRHWTIIDENGKTESVNGPGVIGEYPTITPGSTYSYISCTNFSTMHGTMKGSYTMRNLRTSEKYDVVVPEFHMSALPNFGSTTIR